MPEFASDTHKAVVGPDGIMEVYPLDGRHIKESVIESDGSVKIVEHTSDTTQGSLGRLLSTLDGVPLLKTAYAGNSTFHVDMDCGVTRWIGTKQRANVVAGLRYCGFSREEAQEILDLCAKHTHKFMARVG
jgi:hypothetical protein